MALGDLPWKPAPTDTVWRYDGRRFESDHERGEVRPLADLPPSLDAACRALRGRSRRRGDPGSGLPRQAPAGSRRNRKAPIDPEAPHESGPTTRAA